MATVTLSTQGFFVNGTVGVAFGDFNIVSPAQADSYVLPATAPIGFRSTILNTTANVITLTAPAGQTVSGVVATTTANTKVLFVKTGATTWVGFAG